jgi:hypothetical protein
MKLLDRVRDVAARRHLAASTVECYQAWILAFLRFCRDGSRWRPPAHWRKERRMVLVRLVATRGDLF